MMHLTIKKRPLPKKIISKTFLGNPYLAYIYYNLDTSLDYTTLLIHIQPLSKFPKVYISVSDSLHFDTDPDPGSE